MRGWGVGIISPDGGLGAASFFGAPRDAKGRAFRGWLIFSVLILVGGIALFLRHGTQQRAESVEEGRRDVLGVTASVSDQVTRALEGTDIALIEMARGAEQGRRPWEEDRITQWLNHLPHLRAILVTDADGVVRHATADGLVGRDLRDRPWVAAGMTGASVLVIGRPEAGRFLGLPGQSIQEARRWSIPIARPIIGLRGERLGMVVALLNPEYLVVIGQRAAQAFEVDVRFHLLDGTLLARADGAVEGIGAANPQAWMFRDFLPRFDNGVAQGRDSADVSAVMAFAVTTTGMVVVETSRAMESVVAPVHAKMVEFGIGLGTLLVSILGMLLVIGRFSRSAAQQQEATMAAEKLRLDAQREATTLRSARAETERLLGGVPTLMFHVELPAEGRLRYRRIGVNVEAVSGWPAEVIERTGGWRALRAPDTDAFRQFIPEVAADGRGVREFTLLQPDGSLRWLRTIAMVVARQPDGGTEIVGYTADITAERDRAAQLAAAGRLASLGEMATCLAHELRQPLTIMSLAAQNLKKMLDAGKTEGIGQRVQRIVDQSARAGNIIEHLRRFARGSDQGEPPSPVALGDAVEGAMTLVGGSLRDAEVELVVDIPATAPDVLAHLVGLEQVLVNLTMNACHALEGSPAGTTRRITIALGQTPPEGMVEIQVRDTGGGIAPQVMSRLFEPFVTTKGAEKGTGLGLSICHGLISAMGGTIRATNESLGAVFTITLKAAQAEASAGQPPRTDTAGTSQSIAGSSG